MNQNSNKNSSNKTIPVKTSPDSYNPNDPLLHYKHICDKCHYRVEKNIQANNLMVESAKSQPSPFDPNDLLTNYLNTCYKQHEPTRCDLRP